MVGDAGLEPATPSLSSRRGAESATGYDAGLDPACTSQCTPAQIDPETRTVLESMALMSAGDRVALLDHVQALAALPPEKRAAVLALVAPLAH